MTSALLNLLAPDTPGAGMTDPFNAPTTIDEARAVVAEQRNASLNASFNVATTNVQAPATSVSFGSSARRQILPTLDKLTKTFGPVIKYPPPGKDIEYVHPATDPSAPAKLPMFTAAQLSPHRSQLRAPERAEGVQKLNEKEPAPSSGVTIFFSSNGGHATRRESSSASRRSAASSAAGRFSFNAVTSRS